MDEGWRVSDHGIRYKQVVSDGVVPSYQLRQRFEGVASAEEAIGHDIYQSNFISGLNHQLIRFVGRHL